VRLQLQCSVSCVGTELTFRGRSEQNTKGSGEAAGYREPSTASTIGLQAIEEGESQVHPGATGVIYCTDRAQGNPASHFFDKEPLTDLA
jgi:hypothetical protein